jgi:hypothetical protein
LSLISRSKNSQKEASLSLYAATVVLKKQQNYTTPVGGLETPLARDFLPIRFVDSIRIDWNKRR